MNRISRRSGQRCILPVVTCECCTGSDSGSGGYFTVDRQFGGSRIQVCSNNWDGDTTALYRLIHHEMIHALQYCNRSLGRGCDSSVCAEIEAYYHANCHMHRDAASRKACVKGEYGANGRGAGYSSSFYCTEDEFEEAFERLYDECKNKNH